MNCHRSLAGDSIGTVAVGAEPGLVDGVVPGVVDGLVGVVALFGIDPTAGTAVTLQAAIALTLGVGLIDGPPPGWISKWRCGIPASPVMPT